MFIYLGAKIGETTIMFDMIPSEIIRLIPLRKLQLGSAILCQSLTLKLMLLGSIPHY